MFVDWKPNKNEINQPNIYIIAMKHENLVLYINQQQSIVHFITSSNLYCFET